MIGAVDHQVDVEKHPGVFPDGGDHGGAEGDVVDEVAVHDIEVEPARARGLRALHLGLDVGEVGGEERGDDERAVEIHVFNWPFSAVAQGATFLDGRGI